MGKLIFSKKKFYSLKRNQGYDSEWVSLCDGAEVETDLFTMVGKNGMMYLACQEWTVSEEEWKAMNK